VTEVHYVMGTYFQITAEHADPAAARGALRRCFAATRAAEARFSRFDPHSELSHINTVTDAVVPVSPDMAGLLRRALALSTMTDGAFDISNGALTALWREATVWPSAARILEQQQRGGFRALAVADGTLRRPPQLHIDLDGIAKGWAVDACVAQLRGDGVTRALLSFGESSLYALGTPGDAPGWKVALRGLDGRTALGALRLRDQAASVSAVFGHAHRIGRRRVGHIIDPRSGLPLCAPALAVVVAPSATDAEAWSKAVLLRGVGRAAGMGLTGAVLVRPGTVEEVGHVPFTRFATARPIPAAMEPLR